MIKQLSTVLLAVTLFSCKKEDTDTPQSSLDNGLVLWLPFSGNTLDSTDNHNNAFVSGGPTLTTDRFGAANKAYYFNGTSSFMWIPYNAPMHLVSDFTISMWLKPDESSLSYGAKSVVYLYGDSTVAGHDPAFLEYNVVNHNTNIATDRGDGTIANELVMPSNIAFRNIWVHVAGSWNQATQTLKVYANGRLTGTQQFTVANIDYGSATQNFVTYIGATDRKYVFYKGSMDDIRIYNRTITDAEAGELPKLGN